MKSLVPSLAIVVLNAALFAGCNAPQFSATRDFEKVIPINSQVDVNVQTFNGSINVTPSSESEITLVAHAKAYGNTQAEVETALESLVPQIDTTTTAINIECKKRNQLTSWSDSVSLELKVPANWPLHLTTSNGSVLTSQSRGPVIIKTSNGKIDVKEAAGSLRLTTSNGKITIENSAGNMQASSSNGTVRLIDCVLEGKSKLQTSNGAISVNLSERIPIQLDASTSNGAIKFNEADIDVAKKSKSHLSGVLFGNASGTSPNASLELVTSNGSISIMTDVDALPPKRTPTEPITIQ